MKIFKYKSIFILFWLLFFYNYTATMELKVNVNNINKFIKDLEEEKLEAKKNSPKEYFVIIEGSPEQFYTPIEKITFKPPKLEKESINKILELLENKTKQLELISTWPEQIDQKQFRKSTIKKITITNFQNLNKQIFCEFLSNNLQTLILDQELSDDCLENLPNGLKRLDVSRASGLTGDFLSKLKPGIKELKLGGDIKINKLYKLFIVLEYLCLKKTKIKKWPLLKNFSKALRLRINDNFRDSHIKFLPKNLKLLDLSPVTENYFTKFTGKDFRKIPKATKFLIFYCLKNINPENLHDLQKKSSIVLKCKSPEFKKDLEYRKKMGILIERGIRVLGTDMKEYKI